MYHTVASVVCIVPLLLAPAARARTVSEIIDSLGDGIGNPLSVANAIATDGVGNVYVTGANSDNVFRITPGGTITEIIDATGDRAGNPLDLVRGVAVDVAGNVYVVAEFSNNAFKIDTPTGCSTSTTPCTIVEIIDSAGDGAGHALAAAGEIAVDGVGNVYVVGMTSDNAFKITPARVITEVIAADGDRAGNKLDLPMDVETDAAGNVYVMGHLSDNVFKIDAPGSCSTSTILCSIREIVDVTGDGAGHGLRGPNDSAVDGNGNVYVTGEISHNGFCITPTGSITEIIDASGDRAGRTLAAGAGVAADSAGNVYVSGFDSDNAFKIDVPGTCSTSGTPCTITEIIDASGDGAGNTLDGVARLAVLGTNPIKVYVPGFMSHNAFEVKLNEPPQALCLGVTVATDAACIATVDVADIDAGSFDPDGPGDIDSLCITAVDGGPRPCLATVDFIDDLGAHAVTLTITDKSLASDSCDAAVAVIDDTPPSVRALLEPTTPLPARSAAPPRSVCSPPSERLFRVRCEAADNCDATPVVEAKLLVRHQDLPARGTCAPRVDVIPVLCDEIVEIRLLKPSCPARPRSPRSSLSVNSAGLKVVTGENVTLEVRASDASGNPAVGVYDPTTEPSPLCDEVLDDGTCCPAIAAPVAETCKLPVCAALRANIYLRPT